MKMMVTACLFLLTISKSIIGAVPAFDYPIRPVGAKDVQATDDFWADRIETNRRETVTHILKKFEETGRVANFLRAAGKKEGEYEGFHFNDSDVYKIIEGLSYMVANRPDDRLEAICGELVEAVCAAQEPDGYLHPFITLSETEDRWQHPHRHELFSMGHMLEAGVAYYESTGDRKLLETAIKLADRICEDFDPETGSQRRPPEHQVLETGLARLYGVTGDRKYLDMAHHFLMMRGKANGCTLYGPYAQDHLPVLEQEEAVGHAVRATYMYSAMADVSALTGYKEYQKPLRTLWENVVSRHLYITGGVGAQGGGESFGEEYKLPNMSSYCETCAAIGMVFWNQRLFQLTGEAKYIDVLERTLYNGLLSGVSLDGKSFFYPNPLASYGQHGRSEWFGCACCPTNVFRFLPKMTEYIYAQGKDRIYVNLFAASEAKISMDSLHIRLSQETSYPWDGGVRIGVSPEKAARFELCVRLPGWALDACVPGDLYKFEGRYGKRHEIRINGKRIDYKVENGYAVIDRSWRKGDRVKVEFPMPIRRVKAHPKVEDDRGMVALQRGPIVYCAEWIDNPGGHVMNRFIPEGTEFETEFRPDLLGGISVVTASVPVAARDAQGRPVEGDKEQFTAIPYYAWANRGRGEMAVWFPEALDHARPLPANTIAFTSSITTSGGLSAEPIADQLEPRNSSDHSIPYFHWWPKLGTAEWVRFDFKKPEKVSVVKVYWFDDTGSGACRVPKSWRILYREGQAWKPVVNPDGYTVQKDQYNVTRFDPIETEAIKVEIQMLENFSSGLLEVVIQ